MIEGSPTADATVEMEVPGKDVARMLESLEEPIVTDLTADTEPDGTVDVSMEMTALRESTRMTTKPDGSGEAPVYESDVNWHTGRVNTDDWDVGTDTAERVYEKLLSQVSEATKAGNPDVVVVGKPQYKALWVYVESVHESAENPEQLVPLRMVVVPGPQLHVERRNLDVLYADDR